jgi:hypothetical protein
MVQKWAVGYYFHARYAFEWGKFFMSEKFLLLKARNTICRIPPYMAYNLGFALHVAGWKLNISEQ